MSTDFQNIPSGVIPSSFLTVLTANVSGESSVDFSLADSEGNVLLQESYYPVNGQVEIYDVNVLIEQHMRNRNLAYSEYTATIGSASRTLSVLYCERQVDTESFDEWLSSNFLTSQVNRRVSPDAEFSLSYFLAAGAKTLKAKHEIYWLDNRDNSVNVFAPPQSSRTPSIVGYNSIRETHVSIPGLTEDIAEAQEIPQTAVEILAVNLSLGEREYSIYVDRSLDSLEKFAFYNCFNLFEDALLPTLTTTKTEVSRTLAALATHSYFFDRSVMKQYVATLGPLTSDESDWVDQLISSHSAFHYVNGSPQPMLITEATCEVSDGDDAPNTVKFTWRYAENVPHLRLQSTRRGIFSDHFNDCFA
ncbi:MAG: hypothetical protein NC301_07440 [Bacteroides sp.]|nr:hypothetical protein [Bacteroides sp.]MCM1380000.1 hypothetical protein [Bacteroides sp.]MCM1446320.1 hypothetical protein [Prevotella sp.]